MFSYLMRLKAHSHKTIRAADSADIFLFGRIQSSQTGNQLYIDTSPYR